MKLKHCISLTTPIGHTIIPQVINNEDLDGFVNMLVTTQGVDPKDIHIRTDIELEENEYGIEDVESL